MYYKYIDEFNILEAPKNYTVDGKTICNFNKSINQMVKCGFKVLKSKKDIVYNEMYQDLLYMYYDTPECIIQECCVVDNINKYKNNLIILLDKWLTKQKDLPIFISPTLFTQIRYIEDYYNTLNVINDTNYTFDNKRPLKLILGTLDGTFKKVTIDSFKKAKNIWDKTYSRYQQISYLYNKVFTSIQNSNTIEDLQLLESEITDMYNEVL